jgi:hypothetical protein
MQKQRTRHCAIALPIGGLMGKCAHLSLKILKFSMEESQNEHTPKVRTPLGSVKCGFSGSQFSAKEKSMRLLNTAILSTAPLRLGLNEELDLMFG